MGFCLWKLSSSMAIELKVWWENNELKKNPCIQWQKKILPGLTAGYAVCNQRTSMHILKVKYAHTKGIYILVAWVALLFDKLTKIGSEFCFYVWNATGGGKTTWECTMPHTHTHWIIMQFMKNRGKYSLILSFSAIKNTVIKR